MSSKILYRGAEAVVSLENNLIKKQRIKKSYRISQIDEKLRKLRTRSEAKILEKLKDIVNVPKIISVDENEILMENIDGKRLSEHLDEFPLKKQKQIMKQIGKDVSKMHEANIIHGDLTTSNIILVDEIERDKLNNTRAIIQILKKSSSLINLSHLGEWEGEGGGENQKNNFLIYFIDFGLGFQNGKYEDKAVDLHLLNQALEAMHFKNWKELFNEFEKNYISINKIESKKVLERLNVVEKRGRYRH